jgi:hypothetical protein
MKSIGLPPFKAPVAGNRKGGKTKRAARENWSTRRAQIAK